MRIALDMLVCTRRLPMSLVSRYHSVFQRIEILAGFVFGFPKESTFSFHELICAAIEMNYPFVRHEQGEDPTFIQRDPLNPNLPADMHQTVLHHLASNDSEFVRFLVAVDPVCPAEILEKYIRNEDEDWDVQDAAITNPSCPEKLLEMLKDDDRYQDKIALNTSCPEYLLEYLARKGESSFTPWSVASRAHPRAHRR